MSRTIILIWGAAILLFLLVSKSSGSTAVINSTGNFVNGLTKTLQGR